MASCPCFASRRTVPGAWYSQHESKEHEKQHDIGRKNDVGYRLLAPELVRQLVEENRRDASAHAASARNSVRPCRFSIGQAASRNEAAPLYLRRLPRRTHVVANQTGRIPLTHDMTPRRSLDGRNLATCSAGLGLCKRIAVIIGRYRRVPVKKRQAGGQWSGCQPYFSASLSQAGCLRRPEGGKCSWLD